MYDMMYDNVRSVTLVNRILAEQHFRLQFSLHLMHQPIPPALSLPPSRADPRTLALFGPWMANSRGWGLLSRQIPRGGDEKREQMPRSPSTLQHFSLIGQSNSSILSILMCDFLF